MSVRVYTLITPAQRADLEARAAREDRSMSYLIAKALETMNTEAMPVAPDKAEATEKVFCRTSSVIAEGVKAVAFRHECHEWQVVNAAIIQFMKGE
jgi:hypothetical protein